jgi:hypothetical protein
VADFDWYGFPVTTATSATNVTITNGNTAYYPWEWVTTTTASTNPGQFQNDRAWANWQGFQQAAYQRYQPVAPVSEEQRQRLAEHRERVRADGARREAAATRARELLLENLTPEQRDDYERELAFTLHVGPRQYRIRRGIAGNITLIEDDVPVERWCVHVRDNLPPEDNVLAQVLMLQCGEEDTLREMANIENLVPPAARRDRLLELAAAA